MDLGELRQANLERQRMWAGAGNADTAFRCLEVCGEVGELAEAVKKLERSRRGIAGTITNIDDVVDELGDVLIALDLLAADLGINLAGATRRKFNKTSDKYKIEVYL